MLDYQCSREESAVPNPNPAWVGSKHRARASRSASSYCTTVPVRPVGAAGVAPLLATKVVMLFAGSV